MMKQLSLSLALVFAVACKTDTPAPSAAGSADQPSGKVRSAKIDVKPVAPTPPALPAATEAAPPADRRIDPAAREAWRQRRMAKLDKDGDGVVSDAERAAAMKERMTEMHTRLDADGDGKVSPAEMAARADRMHIGDPATLDTNHDGDISADELAAAMQSRRDARRALREGGDPGSAAPAPTGPTAQ